MSLADPFSALNWIADRNREAERTAALRARAEIDEWHPLSLLAPYTDAGPADGGYSPSYTIDGARFLYFRGVVSAGSATPASDVVNDPLPEKYHLAHSHALPMLSGPFEGRLTINPDGQLLFVEGLAFSSPYRLKLDGLRVHLDS